MAQKLVALKSDPQVRVPTHEPYTVAIITKIEYSQVHLGDQQDQDDLFDPVDRETIR